MRILNETHTKYVTQLIQHNVDFIIVGGYSVIFHGYIRTTGDLDIWLRPDNDNKKNLVLSLKRCNISGDSLELLSRKDFSKSLAFHFGSPPQRIEFLTHISGLDYEKAKQDCEYLNSGNIRFPFLGLKDLIVNKLTSSRLKDKADVEELQKIQREK